MPSESRDRPFTRTSSFQHELRYGPSAHSRCTSAISPFTCCSPLTCHEQTIYAVDISKPALAWVYVTAAQQASYLLGFHTRLEGADGSGAPNKMGLLFWAIYFLEKTLCLRLGRCSTILDIEITVPLPGGSPTSNDPSMGYFHQLVRLASLAGRTYERLYSAHALAQPNEARQQRVVELSQELQDISTKLGNAVVSYPGYPWNHLPRKY